jgi:hypothetical protein
VSPIELRERQLSNKSQTPLWIKTVTEWSSLNRLSGNWFSDLDFSYRLNNDFIEQVGRRARSWEGKFYIHKELDLAVQLYSVQLSTHLYKESQNSLKKQLLGQFLTWEIQQSDFNDLMEILDQIGLTYVQVEHSNDSETLIEGVICKPMFNPELGLFSQAFEWNKYQDGEILYELKTNDVYDKLPGKRGSDIIKEIILSYFNSSNSEAQDEYIITENESISGLPLNHKSRRILIQRFFYGSPEEAEKITKTFKQNESHLANLLTGAHSLDFYVELIDGLTNDIISITLAISPELTVPSQEFIESNINAVDKFLFNHDIRYSSNPEGETHKILQLEGEIMFEGYFDFLHQS